MTATVVAKAGDKGTMYGNGNAYPVTVVSATDTICTVKNAYGWTFLFTLREDGQWIQKGLRRKVAKRLELDGIGYIGSTKPRWYSLRVAQAGCGVKMQTVDTPCNPKMPAGSNEPA